SRELQLEPAESAIYGKARATKRLYQVGAQRFVIIVIDGTNNRHAVHDPLYCFRGAGWSMKDEEPFPIPGGSAKLLRLTNGRDMREALHWFSDGAQRYSSSMRYWWQTTLRR